MASTSSPCAGCKYLRRRCAPECTFAPYFPPDQPQKFANVHKIFGASNASKLLNDLPVQHRDDAANSLAYEAEARIKDPVYGCVGAITILQRQSAILQQELALAKSELARYTTGRNMILMGGASTQASSSNMQAATMQGPSSSCLGIGMSTMSQQQQQQQQQRQRQQELQQQSQILPNANQVMFEAQYLAQDQQMLELQLDSNQYQQQQHHQQQQQIHFPFPSHQSQITREQIMDQQTQQIAREGAGISYKASDIVGRFDPTIAAMASEEHEYGHVVSSFPS